MLFPTINIPPSHISTFRSMCTVPNMYAFCSSLMSCPPGMLFGYFANDFEMVPVAPIVTGITSTGAFVLHSTSALCTLFLLQLLSMSHFYLLKLQCPLTHTFLVHYHRFFTSGLLLRTVLSSFHFFTIKYSYLTFMTYFY